MDDKSFETLAVHAGEDRFGNHGAVSVPIYQATVFAFPNADVGAAIHNYQKEGYFYGRLGNPTQTALEVAVAVLENADAAYAMASGMAAVSAAILSNVASGDHIIAPESMYSTTTLFLAELRERYGITTTFVDAQNPKNYLDAITETTKVMWIETPSNPLLTITDIVAVAKIARDHNVVSIIDNTFATPYNQQPLELGVDLVVHSATKYFGGHSDLTAGLIAGRKEVVDRAKDSIGKLYGGNIAPQIAWLVLRGIKTLALRMRAHNNNAYVLANMLLTHPKVSGVFYPGLESHPNHEVAKRQMKGFGGMISLDVGSIEAGKRFVNNVRLAVLATSLGGVETIVQHSASMTHATLSREERLRAGVTDGLIRLSVGVENVNDLSDDLNYALSKI